MGFIQFKELTGGQIIRQHHAGRSQCRYYFPGLSGIKQCQQLLTDIAQIQFAFLQIMAFGCPELSLKMRLCLPDCLGG